MKSFNNKVAVITGAGGGIGVHFQRHLLNVSAISRWLIITQICLKNVSTLTDTDVKLSTHIADVTEKQRMAALPDEIVAEHGRIDLLINNAGITSAKKL